MKEIKIVIRSWASYYECNEKALGSNWLTLSDYTDWEEIEEKHNCTVYAITHEFTEFDELYNFLLVTDYPE